MILAAAHGRPLLFAAALAATTQTAQADVYPDTPAPIALGTSSYTQDFNSLASTGITASALPAGWQVREDGPSGEGSYRIGDGSLDTGDVYSFGAKDSGDRALGILNNGNLTPAFFGAFFTNDLGATIESLAIGFNGEQWRNGFSNGALIFEYSLDATSLAGGSWTAFSGLNFASPNSASVASVAVTGLITGLSIVDGTPFAVRWSSRNMTGTDDALAIDDFSLVATAAVAGAVPEPSTWAMMIAGFGFVGASLRRTRRRPLALA